MSSNSNRIALYWYRPVPQTSAEACLAANSGMVHGMHTLTVTVVGRNCSGRKAGISSRRHPLVYG